MSNDTPRASNLIEDLVEHLPEQTPGDYREGWQDFCNTFATKLADDPDRTLEQLLQSQIMMAAQMYFRTLFEIHRLTDEGSEDSSSGLSTPSNCQLPAQVIDTWIPRMNRQQKMLTDMIDTYGRFKTRVNRLESDDE